MSAAAAAAAAAALSQRRSNSAAPASPHQPNPFFTAAPPRQGPLGRYEAQKARDWNTFLRYLRSHNPPVALTRFCGDHVLEFLDQFGGTKVHSDTCPLLSADTCPLFIHSPDACACPSLQACGSLDGVVGRLRAAFVEHGGPPAINPFGSPTVRLYLKEVRESQDRARGRA